MRWVRGARRPLQGRWICAWYPGVALEDSPDPRLRTSSPFGLRGREARGAACEVRGARCEVSESRWGRVCPEREVGGERVRRVRLAARAIRTFGEDAAGPASGSGWRATGASLGVRSVCSGGGVLACDLGARVGGVGLSRGAWGVERCARRAWWADNVWWCGPRGWCGARYECIRGSGRPQGSAWVAL